MAELIDRLCKVLDDRHDDIEREEDYYEGELPRLVLPDRTLPSYRAIVSQARSPWGSLVIDAASERLCVDGFRVVTPDGADADAEADKLAWDIWEHSRGEVGSQAAFQAMLLHGASYVLVEPGDDLPLISFEHPEVAATLTAPGGRGTIAAIKRWHEDDLDVAVLWTPEGAATLVRNRARHGASWELSGTQLVTNTTGVVPMFPMKNKPDLRGGYSSDLDGLYNTIDRTTQSIADRVTTQFFASTMVRYLIGVSPELDEDGNPTASALKMATDKLLLIENPDAKAGALPASDLRQFIEVARSDISALAAISRLPSFLLSGDLINVSAEALRSLMQGLVSRVVQRQVWAAPALSDAMRLALRLAGDARATDPRTRVEVVWGDVVEPDLAAAAQSASTLTQAGVLSKTAAQEFALGLSPSQIAKYQQYERVDALNANGVAGIQSLFTAPAAELAAATVVP